MFIFTIEDYMHSFLFNSKLSCLNAVFLCFATTVILLVIWYSRDFDISSDSIACVNNSLLFHLVCRLLI